MKTAFCWPGTTGMAGAHLADHAALVRAVPLARRVFIARSAMMPAVTRAFILIFLKLVADNPELRASYVPSRPAALVRQRAAAGQSSWPMPQPDRNACIDADGRETSPLPRAAVD